MNIDTTDLLLSEKLAPITTSMGLIETNLDHAVREFTGWRQELAARFESHKAVHVQQVDGDLETVLRALLPLRLIGASRYLFVPTVGRWVAYFDNGYRGTDPAAISYLATRLGTRSLWIVAKPHTLQRTGVPRRGRQGALVFELYGPEDREWLNHLRTIRLQNNAGRWEFSQSGEPLPFENLEEYEATRVSDRFAFETFKRYLDELGVHPFGEGYYLPTSSHRAVLVRVERARGAKGERVSLKRARRLNGIEDGLRIFGHLISRHGYF